MNNTLLFVGAHNDDAEIFCGGTLLHHKGLGYDIHLAHREHEDEIRKQEQRKANIESGFRSSYFATKDQLYNILIETKPSVVITHWNKDRHPDHRRVSEETLKTLKNLKISEGLPKRLYFCSTYDHLGIDGEFSPSDYIDISEYQTKKEKLINSFSSQNPEYRIQKSNIISQLYGSRIKSQYAEALKEVFYLGKIEPINNLLK